MQEFPETLAAVAATENGRWSVGDAIVLEIETTDTGRAKRGECTRCSAYLAENGYPTWSPGRIRNIFQITSWTNGHAERVRFRKYPIESVIEARHAADSNHERALAILSEGTSKGAIRRAKSAGKKQLATHKTDTESNDPESDEMLTVLYERAEVSAQRIALDPQRIVGQVRDKVSEALRVLEDVVRATTNAIEHDPRRRNDIEGIVRRLEERGQELIEAAVSAARGSAHDQQQLELEA